MIGIFGGTFDPIHYAHLRTALEVQQQLELAELRFIPAAVPPHRSQPLANAQQRLDMVRLAIQDQPGMTVDGRELEREGPSYMVDTLASLRDELGEVPLVLILGMDAMLGLPDWHQWTRLIELAHIVVMERPGAALPEQGELAELVRVHRCEKIARLAQKPAGAVWFVSVSQLDISATDIRARLAAGASPRFLLPDAVLDYILDEGLYGVSGQLPGG
ncbi:MAG: nicotinate-nucleotide adenylyltransferase [Gammaproteobacteria bacterium]|nr:nicotinate-nucleotide adenylyltransferase [Gammaproteobacteria bacterium]